MNITITPARLKGSITPPPSKSQAHRLLIGAALAGGGCRVSNLALSQDIEATRRCLAILTTPGNQNTVLDCGESGSTLRFLIPIALALKGEGRFTGHGRLMERPQQPYFDLFDQKGIFHELSGNILTVRGTLTPGTYPLPGNVSSQFVTGLLYALPLLDGDSDIRLTTPLESKGYVDMTLLALQTFGVSAEETAGGWHISGGQTYRPANPTVEADYSQAAFFFAANGIGSEIDIKGLDPDSAQGDRVIVSYARQLRAPGDAVLDMSQCPDLLPPLAAYAAVRGSGKVTRLTGAARLRAKESDRLTSTASVLNAMGADVEEGPDLLAIRGKDALAGGVRVDCCNDHRIAMMAAVAATRCQEPVTLLGAECVNKSYPDFWADYESLGGMITRSNPL